MTAEHPTLASTATAALDLLRAWPDHVHAAPTGAVWLHHMDLGARTQQLAEHLNAAVLLADRGFFPAALAVVRTSLEHHLLDQLMLLADRYEETIEPTDPATIDEWEADWETKNEPWTKDVVSIQRARKGRALKLVRKGYDVTGPAGEVCEHISPYWVTLEHFDPFVGHPDLQSSTARPFHTVEDLEHWARRNQAVYGAFLRWNSICWNLQLNDLISPIELVQLQVHYSFLSAFTHSTITGRRRLSRPGGPPEDHVLGELVLLYAIAIAVHETAAWKHYLADRPTLLAEVETDVMGVMSDAAATISYFWFLSGEPQPFDFYQEANQRVGVDGLGRADVDPRAVKAEEVRYYPNPVDRLARMHVGETEIGTGFGFSAMWPTLHW